MFQSLTHGLSLCGSLPEDMLLFLRHHGHPRTANHCLQVGAQARRLAERFGASLAQAELAGWLHDISAVIPNAERLAAARSLGLEVLPEEEAHPMLLHQRLSAEMAGPIFGVSDPPVLSAIACHTTLRPGASLLDQIIFVADKIAWDGGGEDPGVALLQAALERSLEAAALCYLEGLVQRGAALPVLHPWAAQAYAELKENNPEEQM
jgi:predicted HD superfamily hydrolase involved in NAD metabolism